MCKCYFTFTLLSSGLSNDIESSRYGLNKQNRDLRTAQSIERCS